MEEIGYPCMLKAVAGGGGKGLRLVRARREVSSAYRAVRSEAASSFGDPRLYVEKYHRAAAPRRDSNSRRQVRHG
jgi:acetyl/propionyl-CoA carboxylase alpha subunit